jgi:hypothetical protein
MTEPTKHLNPSARPHIYVLLDRSGSMEAIRDDVIGGFNSFLTEQQADGDDARVTLVQFDSQHPSEVLVDARRIKAVRPLSHATFIPRGSTPLLDATGLLIARSDERIAERNVASKAPEAIIFVTITDGHENASREFTREDIRKLVATREQQGWTFVFLSAGLDGYADAGGMGYRQRATQTWAPDAAGAGLAFASLSSATMARRSKLRRSEAHDADDFFGNDKPAEADRQRRAK